jgi:hypothetical protein
VLSSAVKSTVAQVTIVLALGLTFFLQGINCQAQPRDVLCDQGNSSFEASFHTGVRVFVGPVKSGALSTRACQGTLSWGKESLTVASGVAQVDLDMFGVQFADAGPVAAFQVREEADTCCVTYKIYSLDDPPRLLRTIAGGEYFAGRDTDLDGRVEIWAGDAGALRGFEGLFPGEVEFVPNYVLRLENGHLYDATPEFIPYFDDVISQVRAEIDPGLMHDFQLSDGQLLVHIGASSAEITRNHRLRKAKIQALEIAWAYLYTGREKEARQALDELWPKSDVNRIYAAIVSAKAQGIASQLDPPPPLDHKSKATAAWVYTRHEASSPIAIMMRVYPPPDSSSVMQRGDVLLELIIDSAGKVRSIEKNGDSKHLDAYIRDSVREWKFIPAFRSSQSVACRMTTHVYALQ